MTTRSMIIRQMECIPCTMERKWNWMHPGQPFPSEADHCNDHGLAGKKRRGDSYQIPQCQWHHVGKLLPGWTRAMMTDTYGPSMAHQQKAYRQRYGSDDELLQRTNAALARMTVQLESA